MIKQLAIIFLAALLAPAAVLAKAKKKTAEYYQISVYHFMNADQRAIIEKHLQEALIPALHQEKISNIGAFAPLSNDTAADKRIYLIFPVQSLQQTAEIQASLAASTEYQQNGAAYLQAAYDHPVYTRMETILLKAFPLAPFMKLPALTTPKKDHIYELRSYESATEMLHINKVKMFNEGGETGIFSRLQCNPVFYASVVAGARMPNLMYMTSFDNMAERDAHWKAFGSDPEWKKLSALPGYQHNVSKSDILFLKALDCSDY